MNLNLLLNRILFTWNWPQNYLTPKRGHSHLSLIIINMLKKKQAIELRFSSKVSFMKITFWEILCQTKPITSVPSGLSCRDFSPTCTLFKFNNYLCIIIFLNEMLCLLQFYVLCSYEWQISVQTKAQITRFSCWVYWQCTNLVMYRYNENLACSSLTGT